MTRTTSSLSRRSFLRASTATGALLLSPFFAQLARGQAVAPRRFVFVVEGNGFEPVTLLSSDARAAYNQANAAAPLAANARFWPSGYRNPVLTVTSPTLTTAPALDVLGPDLASRAAVVLGLSSKITGGGHTALHGALSSARSVGGRAGAATIDAVLGATPALRQSTPLDVLRVGVQPGSTISFETCATAPGKAAPMLVEPVGAFNTLFSSVASDADRAQFANRRRLLDFAVADTNAALATFSGNSAERRKLETYLASLEEMIGRHARMIELSSTLTAVRPELPATNPLYQSGDVLDVFRAQVELVGAALLGGLTNIAVVAMGPGGGLGVTYDSVMPGVTRHDLHHGSAARPDFVSAIHAVTRLQVEALAGLARRLAQTPDTDGSTMLDNTAIVFVPDNGEQHHSTASDFPTLLLGGNAMGLRTDGRTVIYPGLREGAAHRQLSNLWNTIGHAAGLDLNDFGLEGPTRVALGPLSELRA